MHPRGGRGGVAAASGAAFAVVYAAYAAGSTPSWQAFGATAGPAFFPSAGVTVAAMLLTRRALWPAIVAAILAAELTVDLLHGVPPDLAAGYALANAVEPVVGAALTRTWCGGAPDLRRRPDFLRFLAGAVLVGPLAGGAVGGAFVAASFGLGWPSSAAHWFAGDAVGVLVVATPILLWRVQSGLLRLRSTETAAVLMFTAAVALIGFWAPLPPSLLVLPILAWAALRLDMIGAAVAGAVVAFVANVLTITGSGPFADPDLSPSSRLALVQLFIATNVLIALLIAQEAAARLRAIRERDVERRERARLQALSGLAQQLSAALTPAEIGRAVVEQVINDAGASAVNIGLVSDDGNSLQWVTMEGYPPVVLEEYGGGVALSESTVATEAVRTGAPVVIESAEEYARRYASKVRWLHISGAESVVGWPLTAGGAPIGALLLVWPDRQPLNRAQLAYVSAVATMISQALVRARVYADEHARAAVLQSAVLPSMPAETSGLDVCITYEPADVLQGLGGDWYDVMPLPKNRTYFAVGDVVGHGLPAVEDMAQLRSAGRAFAHQGLPPGQLMVALNGFTRHASQGRFATVAVAVFDALDATLSYCSAGHPPPLLRRAATGEVLELTAGHGPVLGPLPEVSYPEARLAVAPGDIMVMYTDGLVERRGMDLDAGIARARDIVGGWDDGTDLSRGCEALHEALAPRPRPDDICIIAVRFRLDGGAEGSAVRRCR